MREIKFRAWDALNKKMTPTIDISQSREYWEWDWIGVFDFPIMQYTGLKDKNGVEIYEGDILIDEIERIFVIISMLGGLSVLPVKYYHDKIGNELIAQPTNDSQVYSALCNFKIIGNIYQNPELLEKP